MTQAEQQQLVIIGGGLAGLSLAIQLKLKNLAVDVTVVERMQHPVAEAAHKVGESLVELSSHYFGEVLGLTPHLVAEQLPKLGLRFFFRPDPAQAADERLQETIEFGARQFPGCPSYQLDRGIFENFLAKRCQELGVTFLDGEKVIDVDIAKGENEHTVYIENLQSKQRQQLPCRWVVDACSRKSPLKRKLGLAKENQHKVSAAWFRIGGKLDVNDLNTGDHWLGTHTGDNSRWFSTNHFMGDGYWLWFIPLSSGSTSIGIVAENASHPIESLNTLEKAMAWLHKHEPLAAAFIENHLNDLQDFRVLRHFSHDCEQVFNKNRWFLTGEAGVFLDPFYSPGSDFIAISNTFITHLIDTDLNAPDTFKTNCLKLDTLYLNLFGNTLNIYQDLYPVFKHPVIMPIKVLWDFSVYWSFTAFLYIQNQFDSTDKVFRLRKYFEDIGAMNEHLQGLFQHWGKTEPALAKPLYIDPYDIEFLKELNRGLTADFADDDAFKAQFIANVEQLKSLYQCICQAAFARYPELEQAVKPSDIYYEQWPEFSGVEQFHQLLGNLMLEAS